MGGYCLFNIFIIVTFLQFCKPRHKIIWPFVAVETCYRLQTSPLGSVGVSTFLVQRFHEATQSWSFVARRLLLNLVQRSVCGAFKIVGTDKHDGSRQKAHRSNDPGRIGPAGEHDPLPFRPNGNARPGKAAAD